MTDEQGERSDHMRPLRVLLVDGGLVPRSDLLSLCERCGFDLVGEAVDWRGIKDLVSVRAADLVIASGPADFTQGLSALDGDVASIAVAPDARASKEYVQSGAFAVLPASAEPEVVAATAAVAVARAADIASARKETETFRQALETRKIVERAKGVLMRRLSIDEETAYRRMQKASQDENRKMREIAESILSAERLYGAEPNSAGAAAGDGSGASISTSHDATASLRASASQE